MAADWVEQRNRYVRAHYAFIGEVLEDQATVVQSNWEQAAQFAAVAMIFDRFRWDRELADRIYIRNRLTAVDYGMALADELGQQLNPSALDAYLLTSAALSARFINDTTQDGLQLAILGDSPDERVPAVFDTLLGKRRQVLANSSVTMASNLGRSTAAEQSDAKWKRWETHSGNPRPSHSRMRGVIVPINDRFPNGMKWPGDPAGGVDENANCMCSVEFT